jgi:hypothetical protein
MAYEDTIRNTVTLTATFFKLSDVEAKLCLSVRFSTTELLSAVDLESYMAMRIDSVVAGQKLLRAKVAPEAARPGPIARLALPPCCAECGSPLERVPYNGRHLLTHDCTSCSESGSWFEEPGLALTRFGTPSPDERADRQ